MRYLNAGNDNSANAAPSGARPDMNGDPHMDEALDWFTRLQADGGADDRAAFSAWLKADPAHAEAFRRVETLWGAAAFREALERHEAVDPEILDRKPRRDRWFRRAVAVAAVVLIVIVSAFKGPDLLITIAADATAPTGERRVIALADGSEMTLNTGAAASVQFSDEFRRITLLRGEAYFDVMSDPSRPFEVVAGDANVRVVGTRFSVRRNGDQTRVTVAEGIVRVAGRADAAPVELRVGDGIVIAAGHSGSIARTDTDRALAWLNGRLRFHDRPLGEVLQELDRYHAGWIGAVSERARDARVSGNYSLDNPAAVARALADAASVDAVGVDGLVLMVR